MEKGREEEREGGEGRIEEGEWEKGVGRVRDISKRRLVMLETRTMI